MADYTVTGKMSLDISAFIRNIEKAEAALEKAQNKVDKLERAIAKLEARRVNIQVNADTAGAEAKISQIENRLRSLSDRTVRVRTIQTGNTNTNNGNQNVVTRVSEQGTDSVIRKMIELQAAIDRVERVVHIRVTQSGAQNTQRQIQGMSGAMSSAADSGGSMMGALMLLATAAIPVLGVAAGATAGLISALSVGFVGAGTAAIGFISAGKELKGVLEAQANVTKALASGDWDQIAKAYNEQTLAMQKLGPEGKKTVALIGQLKDSFSNFGSSWRGEVFSVFNGGLQAANILLAKSDPIARAATKGFQGIVDQINRKLNSGDWQPFFDYLEKNAGPIIESLAKTIMKFIEGFGNMVMAFDPLTKRVVSGFDDMGQSFLNWSRNLDSNQSFQNFIKYFQDNGSRVWQSLKDIGKALLDIVSAVSGFGGGVLTVLDAFAKVISAVASTDLGGFILQMGAVILSIRTLLKLIPGLTAAGMGAGLANMFRGIGTAATGMVTGVGAGGVAMGRMGAAMSGLKQAGGGLMSAMGGPWGLALAGAVVGIMLVQKALQAAQDTEDKWTAGLKKGGEAAAKAMKDMADQSNSFMGQVGQTLDFVKQKAPALGFLTDAFHGFIPSAKDATDKVKQYEESLTPLEYAQYKAQQAETNLQEVLKNNAPTSKAAKDAADQYRAAQERVEQVNRDVAIATESVTDAMVRQASQAIANTNASIAYSNAQLQVKQAQQQVLDLMKQGKQGTDEFTAATNQLSTSMMNQANAAAEKARSEAEAKGITDTAAIATNAYYQELVSLANQAGVVVPDDIKSLIGSLAQSNNQAAVVTSTMSNLGLTITQIPGQRYVQIDAPTEDQKRRIQDLGYTVITLPNGRVYVTAETGDAAARIQSLLNRFWNYSIPVRLTPTMSGMGGALAGPRAAGGPIKGPGTGTSDSIVAFVSNGEYVINAASVDKYGMKLLDAINNGDFGIKKFATGGPVTIPGNAKRGNDGGFSFEGGGNDGGNGSVGMYVAPGAVIVNNYQPTDTGTSVNRELTRLSLFGQFGGKR